MKTGRENMPSVHGCQNGSAEFKLDNPALESMGVRIAAWRANYVELSMPITATMLNRSGVVHGGTICALLDAATGYAGLFSSDIELPLHAVTLSLTSNFLANGIGKSLTAIGVVERSGKSIYFSRAEVWLDNEKLIATGSATMKYLASSLKHSDRKSENN